MLVTTSHATTNNYADLLQECSELRQALSYQNTNNIRWERDSLYIYISPKKWPPSVNAITAKLVTASRNSVMIFTSTGEMNQCEGLIVEDTSDRKWRDINYEWTNRLMIKWRRIHSNVVEFSGKI